MRIKFELTNQDSVRGKIAISYIAVGQLSSLEMTLNVDEGIYNTKNFVKLKKKYVKHFASPSFKFDAKAGSSEVGH